MDRTPASQGPFDTERFRLFVSNVSDYAICTLTPQGYVSSWNLGARRCMGYAPEEIIDQHYSRFYTEEDRANGAPEAALRLARENGKYETEGWRVRKDGLRFWATVVIDPIYDGEGELLGYATITRDFTRRKETEDALRASEERFRLLVQGITDYAIFMLSPEGIISNWNAGAERFMGYTEDEVIGTDYRRFYTEEDKTADVPEEALNRARREGRYETEGWRVRKDGSRIWVHAVIDPVYNNDGRLIGFAKVTRDITERREAAEALGRAREALFQSQKLEAIGKLTGGVAHDFNNLLAVIVNGIEILSSRFREPDDVRILESMQRAANRGAKLNHQLLSFARQQPLQQSRHDINALITGFEAVLRRVFDESVRFELHLAPRLHHVLVDATQFEAALLNLVTNSRDAMPEGGAISIGTENVILERGQIDELEGGAYVRVTVRDSGAGMPPEVAALAIDPFFTTKPIGQGTGLGLSQVFGLMQQSRGGMAINSEPGEGTCISLYLPAVHEGELRNDPPERALIVDDEPDVLAMAVELFQTLGYEVLSANNGRDALAILERSPDIGVLFSDVVMPGMNGVQLGKEALNINPSIKVLLASGYAGAALERNNVDVRNFTLIQKPYRTADLLKQLRRL